VLAEDQVSDILVNHAQPVKFKIHKILQFATPQFVMVFTKSDQELIQTHVENV
jgi:hypothetical protein